MTSKRRFFLIYDADQSIRGELSYFVGHALGTLQCALCDISHGPLRQKRAWKVWLGDMDTQGHEVRPIHRNQMTPELRDFVDGRLACVVEQRDGAYSMILSPTELAQCNGQVRALAAMLEPWLDSDRTGR